MNKPGWILYKMQEPPVFYEIKVHSVHVHAWRSSILTAEQAFYKNLVATYILSKMLLSCGF